MRFIALDFETSHLQPSVGAPVTLGVALMDGEDVIDRQEWLFAPPTKNGKVTRAYDVVALEISGTSWTRIKKNGMEHSAVLRELQDFTMRHGATFLPVVAFNAPFDFSWYSELLFLGGSWNQHERRFETFLPPLAGPWQCARLQAVHALPGLGSYSLDAVCAELGLSRSGDTHGALEDAILAGRVLSRIEQMAAKKAVTA